MLGALKRILVGGPLATWQARHERLGKVPALAIFCSDALSSVAYAPEAIALALVVAGPAALRFSTPIALAIAALIVIVATSYWQTIHAYPAGGGAYTVAMENLGPLPGLVAGASLLIGYVLTVAVSVAAGVEAVTSAFPALYESRVWLGTACVAFLTVINLRGIRETGRILALPTYWFIGSLGLVIGVGFVRVLAGGEAPGRPAEDAAPIGAFLLLRAFSSGCAALTGIEAVANCVQAFKPPEARNAGITLAWMAGILAALFLGLATLSHAYQLLPLEGETMVSQVARLTLGSGGLYLMVQVATMVILLLAANTCYAGFPMLASLLAQARFLPRQLGNRGDRLVYSNGILILSAVSVLLLVTFGGKTHALLPLYALGVFLSFTLSQAGMVRRWVALRTSHWARHALVNAVGATATAVVTAVIGITKFAEGAWMVVLVIPLVVLGFRVIHGHYVAIAQELSLERLEPLRIGKHPVLVLVSGLHRGVLASLALAQKISPDVTAVTVDLDPTATARLRQWWPEWAPRVPLIVLESPYRSILHPLLAYLDRVQQGEGTPLITIILPEFVPARWWEHVMHNQTALLIKGALLFRRGTVVVSVPHHLKG